MTLLNHEPQQSLSLSISLPFSLVSWFPVEAGWWCGDERSLVAPPPHSGPPQLHSSLPKLVPKTCSPAQQPGPLPWGHSGATPGGPTHPVWFSALQPVFFVFILFFWPLCLLIPPAALGSSIMSPGSSSHCPHPTHAFPAGPCVTCSGAETHKTKRSPSPEPLASLLHCFTLFLKSSSPNCIWKALKSSSPADSPQWALMGLLQFLKHHSSSTSFAF